MKTRFPLLVAAIGLSLASLKAEDTRSLLEREPEGWTNLLANFADWERVPYAPRPLAETNPWKLDPATGILDCNATKDVHELLLFREPKKDGVIHVEWRYVGELPKPNSGLFIRTSKDALTWLQAHMSTSGLGSIVGTIHEEGKADKKLRAGEKRPELQRPNNEWNVMEVVCKGSELTLWINGQTVATLKDCPILEGRLGLEAEFNPVQFRNFQFKPASN